MVRGHVGNSAAVPALQALGHEVWPVPSVVLSNHPAHGAVAGTTVSADILDGMLDRLAQFGWLGQVDAVLTGYFRDPGQVEVAARHIERLRAVKPRLLVFVDPIMGDDPRGLYVPLPVAEAIRDRLLPLADVIVPNRFELAWLAGQAVSELAQARAAAARLRVPQVVVTSFALRQGMVSNLLIAGDQVLAADIQRRPKVPQGTGDLLSSLMLGHLLNGHALGESLGRAVAGVDAVLDLTGARDELALAEALPLLKGAAPVAVEPA